MVRKVRKVREVNKKNDLPRAGLRFFLWGAVAIGAILPRFLWADEAPGRRTFIFFLSADARRFHSPEIAIKDGQETFRNIYFPQEHFLYLKKMALQKRGAFNSIIYYDPASDAPETDTKIVVVTERTYRQISLVETDSVQNSLSDLIQYVPSKSRVSLFYFGHSLISPYQDVGDDPLPHAYDESSPDTPFRLAQFVYEIQKSAIHYESISFFSCRMSSIEVLTELLPYTDYVLGNVYPTSHKSWWATFRFLETVQPEDTMEQILENIVRLNRLNSEKNLETGRSLRVSHFWNYFRLAYLNEFNQALEGIWHDLYKRYVRGGDLQGLMTLVERSQLEGNWDRRLMGGIDIGKFLSVIPTPAQAGGGISALDLLTTPGKLLGEPYDGVGDSGLWVVSDIPDALKEEYGSFSFNSSHFPRLIPWLRK